MENLFHDDVCNGIHLTNLGNKSRDEFPTVGDFLSEFPPLQPSALPTATSISNHKECHDDDDHEDDWEVLSSSASLNPNRRNQNQYPHFRQFSSSSSLGVSGTPQRVVLMDVAVARNRSKINAKDENNSDDDEVKQSSEGWLEDDFTITTALSTDSHVYITTATNGKATSTSPPAQKQSFRDVVAAAAAAAVAEAAPAHRRGRKEKSANGDAKRDRHDGDDRNEENQNQNANNSSDQTASSTKTPNYSEGLLELAKTHRKKVMRIERRLRKFLLNDAATSVNFPPMSGELRKLLHEYAPFWGNLTTQSHDAEPHRYVQCLKTIPAAEQSRPNPPTVLLSEASLAPTATLP